jgi:hypothetical protein
MTPAFALMAHDAEMTATTLTAEVPINQVAQPITAAEIANITKSPADLPTSSPNSSLRRHAHCGSRAGLSAVFTEQSMSRRIDWERQGEKSDTTLRQ